MFDSIVATMMKEGQTPEVRHKAMRLTLISIIQDYDLDAYEKNNMIIRAFLTAGWKPPDGLSIEGEGK